MPDIPEPQKPARAPLAALLPLVPYALKYRGRIAAALVALIVASAATLTVPLAVRRMIDFGFSDAGSSLIDTYFLAMVAVVAARRKSPLTKLPRQGKSAVASNSH